MVLSTTLGLICSEIANYVNYKRTVKLVEEKKNFIMEVDFEQMEKYLLRELTNNELVNWICSSMNYRTSDNSYKKVPFRQISRNKMIEWVGYHVYFKLWEELNEDQRERSMIILSKLEEKIGYQFPELEDDLVQFMKFGHNDIKSIYKPILFYTGLHMAKCITYLELEVFGFKKYKTKYGNIVYFHYHDNKNSKTTMFIHGLGFGIMPYLTHILDMRKYTNLIVPILPNISNMEFTSGLLKRPDHPLFPDYHIWKTDVKSMIFKHNIDKFNVVCHSFGTIILASLIKDPWINSKIEKKIFIDPVCFIDGCHEIFEYINKPANSPYSITTSIFNKLIYDDIYVRYVTQRFLYGPEFWISDYEGMSNHNNLVILSFNDKMVPVKAIYDKMTRYNVPCLLIDNAQHADIFLMDEFKLVLDYVTQHIIG